MTPRGFAPLVRVALAALLACVLGWSTAAAQAQAKQQDFDIPSGQASATLKQFAKQVGEQLLFSADAVNGAKTNAVKGRMTARAALDTLLANSGLVADYDVKTGSFAVRKESTAEKNVQRAAQVIRSDRPRQNPESSSSDETVELSPFTVSADADVGYVAQNTLAGSRLNTSLRDTAASLSVLTAEFLSDIGATSLTEAMEWSTNSQLQMQDTAVLSATTDDTNSTFYNYDSYRVRGIPATTTRNYFAWRMPIDSYNIERVEEARGPNSILFGIGSAGGVVNTSTKRANISRDFRRASAGISSHGGYRGTFDVNERFGGKLALRLNGVYDRSESFRNYSFGEKRQVHLAATYKLLDKTRLRAEYETGLTKGIVGSNQHVTDRYTQWVNAGSNLIGPGQTNTVGTSRFNAAVQVYYIGNSGTLMNMANQYRTNGSDFPLDPSIASYEVSTGGPGATRRGDFDVLSFALEHQFGQNTFLEVAFNHQEFSTKNFQPSGDSWRLYMDPNATLPTGASNPNAGQLMLEGTSWAWLFGTRVDTSRVTLAHDLDIGKWGKYRFAGMGEYEWRSPWDKARVEVWDGAPYHQDPENAANVVRRRNYVTAGDWASYYRTMPMETGFIQNLTDPVTGRTLSSTMVPLNMNGERDNPEYQTTLLLATQARYFRDRLVLGLGYRWDSLDITTRGIMRNPDTRFWQVDYGTIAQKASYEGRTRTAGVVYHVTPKISVFYNNSDNFSLPPANRILPNSQRGDNPEATGEDFGVAISLFDGKLFARASHYQTEIARGIDGKYNGTLTNPTSISNIVLNALVDQNVLTAAEANTHRINTTGATFDQKVKGYELNLTANPTRNWRLQANFSYTDGFTSNIAPEVQDWIGTTLAYLKTFDQTIVTANAAMPIGEVIAEFEDYNQQQLDAVGLVLPGNRKYKTNLFTSYSFSEGMLRGVTLGGGYRHQSKLPIGLYADQSLQYGPSYWDAHGMLSYRFTKLPVPWVKRFQLQLNVQNMFNEDDAYVFRRTKTTPELIHRIRVREPRSWRLTASFEF